jgi:hypothetical protein
MKRFLKGVLRAPQRVWSWMIGSTIDEALSFAWRPHHKELAKTALDVTRRLTGEGVTPSDQARPNEVAKPSVPGLTRNSRIFYSLGLSFVFWSIFQLWQDAPWWQAAGTFIWGGAYVTCGLRSALAAHSIRSSSKVWISDPSGWFI